METDINVAVITAIITAGVTLTTAIITHFSNQSKERELKQKELDQKTFELFLNKMEGEITRQEALYREALAVAQVLAFAENPDGIKFQEKKARFWELYYGELPMFEPQEVALAMIQFGKMLNEKEKGTLSEPHLPNQRLIELGKAIGNNAPVGAFTKKIIRDWNLNE